MSDETRGEVERLFHELRPLSEGARRERLNGIADRAIRDELASLFEHEDSSPGFLERPTEDLGDHATPIVAESDSIAAGHAIGPYKILDRLGSGGFGEVYLAEQRRPVRRRVALKVIKRGMDTREVIRRFELERQALALMDHPSVARVFEAGETDDGRPYIAMEYVRGLPITDFADSQRMSISDRLELFIPVCEAVQHAHQKGIIHRDLKPSNILVELVDGKPTPKVIDFGIAKAVTDELVDHSVFTRHGQFWGTLEYASPEQVENSPLGIDTRTDVYSLGVVLYQLLTGHLPFDSQTLRQGAMDEVRRILREVVPTKPSLRTPDDKTRGSSVATKTLRGDVDWIVLRALEKDRGRRYDSASALADDIRRFLRSEPVVAGPPSVSYRFRKFVRRHRVGVGVAGAAAAVVVFAAVGTTTQWLRAEAALNEAEVRYGQILSLSGDFIDELDASLAPIPGATAARRAGAVASVRLLEEVASTTPPTAELHASLLSAYRRLAISLESAEVPAAERESASRNALDVAAREPAVGSGPNEVAMIAAFSARLGAALLDAEDVAAATPLVESAAQQVLNVEPDTLEPAGLVDLATVREAMALLADRIGDRDDARKRLDEAISFAQQAVSSGSTPKLVAGLGDLRVRAARFHIDVGRLARAEEIATSAITELEPLAVPGASVELRRAIARAHDMRGYARDSRDDVEGALEDYARAAAIAERLWTDDRLDATAIRLMTRAYDNRADVLYRLGRYGEAETMYRVSLQKAESDLAADPLRSDRRFGVALANEKLGDALREGGSNEEADERYTRALEIYGDLLEEDGTSRVLMVALARTEHHHAIIRLRREDPQGALAALERSVEMYARAAGTGSSGGTLSESDEMDYSLALRFLGYQQLGKKQHAAARESLQRALDTSWRDDPKRHKVMYALALALRGLGDDSAAMAMAAEALDVVERLAQEMSEAGSQLGTEDASIRENLRAMVNED